MESSPQAWHGDMTDLAFPTQNNISTCNSFNALNFFMYIVQIIYNDATSE